MASSKRDTKAPKWYEELNQADIDAAYEQATTDCYGEDEQATGLFCALYDELICPWQAKVTGEIVTVVDVEQAVDDRYGIDMVIERNGKTYRIEARSVEPLKPLPDGHLFLAAYLQWKRNL
ncbi:MAG: hypothetical protein SFV81_24340 [Pirellulaceae bacterium]|nr:hypothetical protein [Pirellulaceae bacterium]